MTKSSPAGGCARSNYPFLTSKERDIETGLDYFGARYFASTHGRFTSVDPILSSARKQNPQTWNRYTYVLNSPLRLVDPLGLYDQQSEQDPLRRLRERQRNETITITDAPATEIQLRPQVAKLPTAQDLQAIDQANTGMGELTATQLTNANQAIQDALGMVAELASGQVNRCRDALLANFGPANPTTVLQSARTTGGAAVMGPDGITTGPQNVFNGMLSNFPVVDDNGTPTTVNGYIASHSVTALVADGKVLKLQLRFTESYWQGPDHDS